jgi:uncharacterized protein (TIGR02594 family)
MAGYRLPGTYSTLEDWDAMIDEGTQPRTATQHPGILSVSERPMDDISRELSTLRRRLPLPATEYVAALAQPPKPSPEQALRGGGSDAAPGAIAQHERAPWMAFAIAEAKRHKGSKETEIEKVINYHAEVGATFLKGLSGSDNAWCASFVGWCLQSAGYVRWRSSFRARAVADDINFAQIARPVFGAIVLVGTHHACFLYARNGSTGLPVCLGGNQSDQINFTEFKETVRYFVPKVYLGFAEKEAREVEVQAGTADELNAQFGITVKKKKHGATR